jgi:hypothetical protein
MRFFVLKRPKSDSEEDRLGGIDVSGAEGTETGEFPKCPHCNCPLGMREWLPPYRVELETWGQQFGDVGQISDGLVVSERFIGIFQEAGLKGLSEFKPVDVVKIIHCKGKPTDPMPRYFKAKIARSSTAVDQVASGYVWIEKSAVCPVCLFGGRVKRYTKIVLDEKSWNGDDIFWPKGGPCIIVSERFKIACEKNEIRNVAFGVPDHESYDYFPWETQAKNKT